jgi:hypothetical protein
MKGAKTLYVRTDFSPSAVHTCCCDGLPRKHSMEPIRLTYQTSEMRILIATGLHSQNGTLVKSELQIWRF